MIQWIFSFILCHLTHTNTNLNILNDNFSLKDMKTWKHFNKSSWQAISPDIVSVNLNPLKKQNGTIEHYNFLFSKQIESQEMQCLA